MCKVKNSPIEAKYRNRRFGDRADQCLVGVISFFNSDKELATVASCCGHGKPQDIPYITLIQPRSRIKEVKTILEERLGWYDMRITIFDDMPDDAIDQLGWQFMLDKVYVGYYSRAKYLNIINSKKQEVWREDDLQVA